MPDNDIPQSLCSENLQPIANNYKMIATVLKQLYIKLYYKLRANGVVIIEKQDEDSFTNLIKNMRRISAIERYYTYNTKPNDNIDVDSLNPDEEESAIEEPIDDVVLQARYGLRYHEYNALLAQKINYYMKLMGYFLALKGVSIEDINQAKTLNARIDLIDKMDRIFLSILDIDIDEEEEYHGGERINVPYSLTNARHETITDGTIIVKNNNEIIQIINVGNPLSFVLRESNNNNYIFEFSGNTHNKSVRVIKTINILSDAYVTRLYLGGDNDISLTEDTDIKLNIAYLDESTDDTQTIITDIDIDNNGDLIITTENLFANFSLVEKGLISIKGYEDGLKCNFAESSSL